jgi:hypothetical protein
MTDLLICIANALRSNLALFIYYRFWNQPRRRIA